MDSAWFTSTDQREWVVMFSKDEFSGVRGVYLQTKYPRDEDDLYPMVWRIPPPMHNMSSTGWGRPPGAIALTDKFRRCWWELKLKHRIRHWVAVMRRRVAVRALHRVVPPLTADLLHKIVCVHGM